MLESIHSVHKFQQICDEFSNLFVGWLDINELVMSKFDKTYLKHVPEDTARLSLLYNECCLLTSTEDSSSGSDGGGGVDSTRKCQYPTDDSSVSGCQMMQCILDTFPSAIAFVHPTDLHHEDQVYLPMLIDIGLVRLQPDPPAQHSEHIIGCVAVSTQTEEFNCGIDLAAYSDDVVDIESAKM